MSKEKKKKIHMQLIAMLFIGIVVVLPIIVRLKLFALPYPLNTIFPAPGGAVSDFALYYKGLFFNLVTWTLVLFVIGQKLFMRKPPKITLFGEKEYRPYLILIGIYMMCTLLSFMTSDYKTLAFVGAPNAYESLIVLLNYGVIFVLALHYFEEDFHLDQVMKAMDGLVIFFCVIGVIEFFWKNIIEMSWTQYLILPREQWDNIGTIANQAFSHQISLTLFNPNYAALFLMMMIPIFICKIKNHKAYRKYFYIGLTLVLSIVFLFARSTAALYALICCMVVEGFIYSKEVKKHIKGIGLSLGIMVVVLGVIDFEMDGILAQTFLGEGTAVTSEVYVPEPYPVEAIHIEGAKIVIRNAQEDLIIEASKQGDEDFLSFTSERDTQISVVLETQVKDGVMSLVDNQYEAIKVVYSEHDLELDLGYDEPIYFSLGDDNTFYGIGPNGSLIMDVSDDSGICFEKYQSVATGRGYIWRKSLPVLKDFVLLGSGPDTASMYIPQNDFAGKLNYHGRVSLVIDKPHSLYLQTGIQTGVISLIVLVALFGWYSVTAIKVLIWNQISRKSRYFDQAVALFVGHIGYFICGLAYDSNLSTAPLFWVFLGINSVLLHKIKRETKEV